MNPSSSQQYIQYSSTSPAMSSHPSGMHLAAASMPMHPHHPHHQSHLSSMQSGGAPEMNSTSGGLAPAGTSNLSPVGGPGGQMSAALLHHAHHTHPHQAYASHAYQANLAHSLASNGGQLCGMPGMHLKADGTPLEMMDPNVSAGMMNGMNGSMAGTNASMPTTVHLTSNGYVPQMMEVIWQPSSHLPNAAYLSTAPPVPSQAPPPLQLHPISNPTNGAPYGASVNGGSGTSNGNSKPLSGSNNRSISSQSSVNGVNSNCNPSSTTGNNASYPTKSAHTSSSTSASNSAVATAAATANGLMPNGYSSSSSSTLSPANNASGTGVGSNSASNLANSSSGVGGGNSNTSSNQSNTNSTPNSSTLTSTCKEKAPNGRHSSSSYGPSHKKMYNGTGSNSSHNYGNTSNNNINSTKSTKVMNGTGGGARYQQVNSSLTDSSSAEPSPTEPPHKHQQHFPKAASGQPGVAPQAQSSSSVSSSRVSGGLASAATLSNANAQALVTKTVNGVQIYALAGSSDEGGAPITSPPHTPAAAVAPVAYKA